MTDPPTGPLASASGHPSGPGPIDDRIAMPVDAAGESLREEVLVPVRIAPSGDPQILTRRQGSDRPTDLARAAVRRQLREVQSIQVGSGGIGHDCLLTTLYARILNAS